MGMSLSVMQTFERLRVLAGREEQRKLAGPKVQSAPAPVGEVFEILSDMDARLSALEKEQDAKGIVVVGDIGKGLTDFVVAHIAPQGGSKGELAREASKAIAGRALYAVDKLKKQYAAEMRGAINQKDKTWQAQVEGGHEAIVKVEEALRELFKS